MTLIKQDFHNGGLHKVNELENKKEHSTVTSETSDDEQSSEWNGNSEEPKVVEETYIPNNKTSTVQQYEAGRKEDQDASNRKTANEKATNGKAMDKSVYYTIGGISHKFEGSVKQQITNMSTVGDTTEIEDSRDENG
jgi:hypothetical protein